MRPTHKKRLLMLANALETRIPADRFDLADWRLHAEGQYEEERRRYVSDHELLHGCGFAGCAVGWACALPEFNEQGLYWDGAMPAYQHGPEGPLFGHFDAVNWFFGLKQEHSNLLFAAGSYEGKAGPLDVARRIRFFVAARS
ncbi:hypothetical protein H4CHR_02949 [Variovorax sp. PBS-H4]|uniref:hypothetical protein n=1 Tax=Variovorax sp. PBS-H4 TaxID=434008 RepID=UPI001318D041|nr:hypothetical protein [Variovorax sp. PBS-H4]VTU32133.1 hypothetical protein H4CHR_02949 [Variovorax sp. PBS-H4]